jgi:hypothetical protein
MLFTAIYRDSAVWAFEVYVGWRGTCLGRLAGFEVHRIVRRACRLVRRMRAVCMLSHKRSPLAYLRYWRVGEGVEQVVFRQDQCPTDTLGVDVFIRLEWLIKLPVSRCRERSFRQCEFRVRWSFGGVVPLGRNILGDRSEGLRGPQLRSGGLQKRQTLSACV